MDDVRYQPLAPKDSAAFRRASLPRGLSLLQRKLSGGPAWELRLPSDGTIPMGSGAPRFRVEAVNAAGLAALKSLDEMKIAQAYFAGDLNLDGDLLSALSLRSALVDRHRLLRFWTHRVQPLIRGQVACDKRWIRDHYEEDAAFYECFLDGRYRCYSQGDFQNKSDTLEDATERKFNSCVEWTGITAGSRVLEVGAGWGSFVQFAGTRGIRVTSLTISASSERYVNDLIARNNLPCKVIREHLLEYRPEEPYDAIVNLGVTEHLPDYPATLRQYERLLKPGGRVYLDASASRTPVSTVAISLIYQGNGRFLNIGEYVQAVQNSRFNLLTVGNDSESYRRTMECWARNFDEARDLVVQRFGERQYRRFRLYLWAGTHAFTTGDLEAYHLVLEKR